MLLSAYNTVSHQYDKFFEANRSASSPFYPFCGLEDPMGKRLQDWTAPEFACIQTCQEADTETLHPQISL